MTTIRERRQRDTLAQLARAVESRDTTITRLVKLEVRIKTLRRQAQRYEKLASQPAPVKPAKAAPKAEDVTDIPISEFPIADKLSDDPIPGFLKRGKLDPVAAEIAREQAETKRLKSRGRIDKMKAKRSGAMKAMPLSGKAALEAIRSA